MNRREILRSGSGTAANLVYGSGRTIRACTTWYVESGRTLGPRLPGWP